MIIVKTFSAPYLMEGFLIELPYPYMIDTDDGSTVCTLRVDSIYHPKASPEISDKLSIPRLYYLDLAYVLDSKVKIKYLRAIAIMDTTIESEFTRGYVSINLYLPDNCGLEYNTSSMITRSIRSAPVTMAPVLKPILKPGL